MSELKQKIAELQKHVELQDKLSKELTIHIDDELELEFMSTGIIINHYSEYTNLYSHVCLTHIQATKLLNKLAEAYLLGEVECKE